MLPMRKTQSKIFEKGQNVVNSFQSQNNLYDNPNDVIRMDDIKTQNNDHVVEMNSIPSPTRQINSSNMKRQRSSFKQQKASQIFSQAQRRQKMPASLKESLRKRALEQGRFRQSRDEKKSRFGEMMSSKLKKSQVTCGICLGVINKQIDIVNICKCAHVYCKNCSRDYVTYKIKMFQQVICPQQNCNMLINQQTQFYNNLANQLKKNYNKIHQFYLTSKDPSLKLCPKQDCEGIIKVVEGQPRICNQCNQQFCPKCYLQKHQGNCDQKEIDFLQNNLHYRQCVNCQFIVERIEGCNHMTCRCKFQFCYVCGKKWIGAHQCNQNHQVNAVFNQDGCLDCCGCCRETCGQTFTSILIFPAKLFMSLVILLVFLLIGTNSLLMIVFYFVATLLAGIFGFSVDWLCSLCDQDKCALAVVCTVLFPIAILVGLYRAFTEMFYDLAQQQLEELFGILTDGCSSIWT